MKEMKKLITAHLGKTDEATAKQIAEALGHQDSQSSVNNALNALRTDGTVECEKRKGRGNELIYWLARLSDDAMPDMDVRKLAQENNKLCERLDGVAHVLRGCGLPALKYVTGKDDLQQNAAALSGAYLMALNQRDAWREMAEMFGKETPVEIGALISELKNRITRLEIDANNRVVPKSMPKQRATPRRPFSVSSLTGYHAQGGHVTLFVDRRLSARSITISADRLCRLAEMARGA